jgi:hypothetical protein
VGISFSSEGEWAKTEKFLRDMQNLKIDGVLSSAAQRGVAALSAATPKETGLAATSWSYEIKKNRSSIEIAWKNSDVENGFPVALMIQYGHGTGTGGYISGRDYINPAMRPVFDEIAETVWKAVTSA